MNSRDNQFPFLITASPDWREPDEPLDREWDEGEVPLSEAVKEEWESRS